VDHSHSTHTPAIVTRHKRAGRTHYRVRRNPALVFAFAVLLVATMGSTASAVSGTEFDAAGLPIQSLDGSGNNRAHPEWGQLGRPYSRVGATRYGDGVGAPASGPNTRMVSNRTINDINQNVFSERSVTQWGWTWGQFLDHTFGLAQGGGPAANIPFNRNDPMETFTNTLGVIPFSRDAAAPGTGTDTAHPREQINTVSSYIDGFSVYSGSPQRLEWLRDGSVDGDVTNNAPTLMLPGGYLPTRDARGDPASAPEMAIDGRLRANPNKAMVAGDVRANENIALTATHTLFAREHNRIVSMLPNSLTAEQKFQVARRVVIAEQQFITYNEWLPAMGVQLPAYRGYNSNVNATLSNEFATVGYRAHSQIHGEFEIETERARYTPEQLADFEAQGVKVEDGAEADEVVLAVPLNVAFFNPNLLKQIGAGPMLKSLSGEPQYKNEEMIDNQLRSVLFQIRKPGDTSCIEPVDPKCFQGVVDLGAIDVERARDHGMPTYNQMRQAYGLAPKSSFRGITGESSESFPAGSTADDPSSLDFTALFDRNGAPIALDSPVAQGEAVKAPRRTPLAARLKAVYRSVDQVDAFTGMISEPHVNGSEFGELQRAIWTKQFQALRDGDQFFYGNDPGLSAIRSALGIDFRRTLSQVIASNTDIPASELTPNVFRVPAGQPLEPGRVLSIVSKRCLDVPNSSQTDGAPLQIFDCNGTGAQGWSQLANGSIQVFGRRCLDTVNGGTNVGTRAVSAVCDGTESQQWTFGADGTIVNHLSGLCLDVDHSGTANGTRVRIWTCNGTDAQKWIR